MNEPKHAPDQAAAPELLEALQLLIDWVGNGSEYKARGAGWSANHPFNKARAAIAKAKRSELARRGE